MRAIIKKLTSLSSSLLCWLSFPCSGGRQGGHYMYVGASLYQKTVRAPKALQHGSHHSVPAYIVLLVCAKYPPLALLASPSHLYYRRRRRLHQVRTTLFILVDAIALVVTKTTTKKHQRIRQSRCHWRRKIWGKWGSTGLRKRGGSVGELLTGATFVQIFACTSTTSILLCSWQDGRGVRGGTHEGHHGLLKLVIVGWDRQVGTSAEPGRSKSICSVGNSRRGQPCTLSDKKHIGRIGTRVTLVRSS